MPDWIPDDSPGTEHTHQHNTQEEEEGAGFVGNSVRV